MVLPWCTPGLLSYTTSSTRSESSGSHSSSDNPGITLQHALRMLYRKVHPDLFTAYPAEKVRWCHAVINLSLTTMITQAGHLCPCSVHASAAPYTSPSWPSSVLVVLLQLENERSFKLLQVSRSVPLMVRTVTHAAQPAAADTRVADWNIRRTVHLI